MEHTAKRRPTKSEESCHSFQGQRSGGREVERDEGQSDDTPLHSWPVVFSEY